ncbi:TPA: TolC family protein [Vibrio vulnificus]|uniref:TolC family protein n=1 Tax=Vibrio vulnificus TaxID=672 RepID=UPI0004F878A9|nr:TolC family protein [Vibrio vulnificus]AIL70567.1 outer membrane protein [Vibrio vulnificus]ELM6649898.1 TolC family protein [Vibrio vulnificus]ELV8591102.1 TolC family protein [Vibrio vulnificus]MCG6285085.1 TolC family protein [Vibrio vulnificus]MCJ0822693.1 TolC family protein [Vibrio vulnificus]
MKRHSKLLMIGLLSSSISLACQAAPITFQQAWQLLQENNHSLAAQRANVESQQHMQSATSSLNLPSISVGANYTRLDTDVTVSGQQLLDSTGQHISLPLPPAIIGALANTTSTITERDIFTSSIRAIWPIFTGGRISAAQAAAEGKTDEARSQLSMETQARYEDLSKYYFSVVLAKEVLQTRQAVEQGLTQHRDFAIKLEKQGQIAHVERLQAEASLDKAKVETRKAQSNLDIAQSALSKILAQNDMVEPAEGLFINQHLPPLTAFTEQTLATYPGLDLLNAKEKQASALIKAEKGKYYPEVYLYGDYSLYEDDSLASEMKPDWLVGVGVNIPLLENTGRSDKVKAANSMVSQVQSLKAQAKEDLSVLVQKTYLEAQQAIDEVIGLESSIRLAKENLDLREKAFNQGLSTSLEVVDAQLYLASVETQQSAARFRYLLSLTKLLALSSEMNSFNQYQSSAYQPTQEASL